MVIFLFNTALLRLPKGAKHVSRNTQNVSWNAQFVFWNTQNLSWNSQNVLRNIQKVPWNEQNIQRDSKNVTTWNTQNVSKIAQNVSLNAQSLSIFVPRPWYFSITPLSSSLTRYRIKPREWLRTESKQKGRWYCISMSVWTVTLRLCVHE